MYKIKQKPEDFVVQEITANGETLDLEKSHEFDNNTSGKNLICILQKKNWDTLLIIKKIAKQLGISYKRIGYAGMKDKNAITTQLISIREASKGQIEMLNIKDTKIIPLKYEDKEINLGDLTGNKFTIKVYSDIKPKKLEKIANYFGEQRFGTQRPISHLVGEASVKEDYKKAVEIYLTKSFESEKKETKKARESLAEKHDYKEALRYYPLQLKFERSMIQHLANNNEDYIGALRVLPKNLLIMFIHAFQSSLFNEFLNDVIEKKRDYKTGPLYGYKLKPENDLEKQILKNHKMYSENFLIREMPEMSSKGERRELFVKLNNLDIKKVAENEYVVEFDLPKGCYATVALRQLFGQEIFQLI